VNLLKYRAYITFLSLGVAIFFLGALSVVIVRTKSSAKVTMPSLVGKNYLQVHNELVRLRLKILIELSRIPEKNDGEILAQSVPPGKIIEVGSHVYLTVNQGFDRVEVPNLIGQTLERGRELLANVLSGEIYVSMPLGGVTFVVPEEGESSGIIIDQIPEPGKITHSGEKVYLLVTESSQTLSSQQGYLNQPIPFVVRSLNRRKIPWKIVGFEPSKRREESGLVSEFDPLYRIKVKRAPQGSLLRSGYEFWEWEVPKSGVFYIELVQEGSDMSEKYIPPQDYKSGETFYLSFYRNGSMTMNFHSMDGKRIKKKKWEYQD